MNLLRRKMKIINIAEKFDSFSEHWKPKIIAELNGQQIRIAKLKGEFVWHSHENEDEMFLVIKGKLTISFRDGDKALNEGEFLVVPKGVEHKPSAEEEVSIMLFEPASVLNTGNVNNDFTVKNLDRI